MGNVCKKKKPNNNLKPYNTEMNSESEINTSQEQNDNILVVKEGKNSKEKSEENGEENIKKIEKDFIDDTDSIRIGLNNIGATCYMNATLQCLSNTKDLNNFFLIKFKYDKKAENKKLTNAFYIVLKNLWKKKRNGKSYDPTDFKNIISEMNSLFEGVQANDSKDLINFLLEQMHEELNVIKEDPNEINTGNNLIVAPQQQNNRSLIYDIFLKNFKKNFNSIISELFYGFTETEIICQNCQTKKYNYEIITFLEFPLETINKFYKKTPLVVNYQQQQPDINIKECFQFYQKGELLTNENMMYCDFCKYTCNSLYTSRIYKPPKYFILILNRGKGNVYNCNVNFTETLDLKPYVVSGEKNNYLYDLYAVICHFGPSSMGGHFVAFCRNKINDKWYCYNDSSVTLCNEKEFLKGVPYILFYQEIEIA